MAEKSEPLEPIPYAKQWLEEDDIEAVANVLRSSLVTQGPQLERFEAALVERTGARYAVVVSSGTAALHLSCLALGVGSGHCGITPAITFAATANCLAMTGAEPWFCDVDPTSGLAGYRNFETALSACAKGKASPKALLPVSFSGAVPELPQIASLAKRHDCFVIEDAAHSIGATYVDAEGMEHRSASCDHSDAAILSFHPVKHICAGEGGAVLTNDPVIARRARRLRSHGIEKHPDSQWRYEQLDLGYHYRMTEMQATLGLSQLGKLNRFLERRRRIAERYDAAFSREPFRSVLDRPELVEGAVWHLYVIRFRNEKLRGEAYDYLHANGIRVQVHYIPVYHHPYYKENRIDALPGSERFYARCLSLPMYPKLRDDEQDRVIECIAAFCQAHDS